MTHPVLFLYHLSDSWSLGFKNILLGEVEVDVKRATPRPKGSGYGSADYYGGMDQYYGYGDYQSWYGGGKAAKDKSAKSTPY